MSPGEKPLANGRHEHFACLMAGGTMSAVQAYITVGYAGTPDQSSTRGNATRLSANESVTDRIAWLKAQAARHSIHNATTLVARLSEVADTALHDGSYAPVVSAIGMIAKILGIGAVVAEAETDAEPQVDRASSPNVIAMRDAMARLKR